MTDDRFDDQNLEEHQVAGNGLLDRRLFLTRGIQFGAISSLVPATALASTAEDINPASPPLVACPRQAIFYLRYAFRI